MHMLRKQPAILQFFSHLLKYSSIERRLFQHLLLFPFQVSGTSKIATSITTSLFPAHITSKQ